MCGVGGESGLTAVSSQGEKDFCKMLENLVSRVDSVLCTISNTSSCKVILFNM
jgi:hypothetical protein